MITGSIDDQKTCDILPEKIYFPIIFEDNHIIVINKPAGLVVHPGAGNLSGTLVNALLNHCPKIINSGDDKSRAGIVHRLDKDTSGIIVVAKNISALKFLKKEFKHRRVTKKYFALVKGVIGDDMGTIILPMGRHPQKRTIMTTKGENLRHAETRWKIKKRFKDATFIEILLKTGRTHQIRVHFYAIGHPLIGETVYQFRRYRKQKQTTTRQMLHAASLGFRHPFSGKAMSFSAPVPDDFTKTLEGLQKD